MNLMRRDRYGDIILFTVVKAVLSTVIVLIIVGWVAYAVLWDGPSVDDQWRSRHCTEQIRYNNPDTACDDLLP
jgi:hypothetical protein